MSAATNAATRKIGMKKRSKPPMTMDAKAAKKSCSTDDERDTG
jgi:hypothetical protein